MYNEAHDIKGYRDLNIDEIEAINEVKMAGHELRKIINGLREHEMIVIDHKWLDDGELMLQKGLMSLVRCIAKPHSF